ncbi:hypothetical protein T310_8842, partial [Rasamsonia emersonii CBS 393.64]
YSNLLYVGETTCTVPVYVLYIQYKASFHRHPGRMYLALHTQGVCCQGTSKVITVLGLDSSLYCTTLTTKHGTDNKNYYLNSYEYTPPLSLSEREIDIYTQDTYFQTD